LSNHKWKLEDIFLGIALLSFGAGALVLAGARRLVGQPRASVLVLCCLLLLGSFAAISLTSHYRQNLKRRRWQQIIDLWKENIRAGKGPQFDLSRQLSAGALKQLAVQVYTRMGYQIVAVSNEDAPQVCIKLLNPEGKVEFVHCFQTAEPLRLPQVRPVKLALACENAVRAYIWAPGGFAADAMYWLRDKPIEFVDSEKIGHLIDCVLTAPPG